MHHWDELPIMLRAAWHGNSIGMNAALHSIQIPALWMPLEVVLEAQVMLDVLHYIVLALQ